MSGEFASTQGWRLCLAGASVSVSVSPRRRICSMTSLGCRVCLSQLAELQRVQKSKAPSPS